MTMKQVSFLFRQTVLGILETLVVRAPPNNTDLTYDVDLKIPDSLFSDALRLRPVMTKLVGNAIKFTSSRHQRRHVAWSGSSLAGDVENVTLEFCVTGVGLWIKQDNLSLISDTLANAEGSTRDHGGTGLGRTAIRISWMRGI